MTRPSIGVAATFRDEHNALPRFIDKAKEFFDDILLVDCSMDMTHSTDGSLDIIRAAGLPDPVLWSLADGFGAVRSQLIQTSKTDFTVILDIDECMYVELPQIDCAGNEAYPQVQSPDLKTYRSGSTYDHRGLLIAKIQEAAAQGIKAVRFSRRHWFDLSWERPTQNWITIPDWQLRCMKSRDSVGYRSNTKMHEQAWDLAERRDPRYIEETPGMGPYIDHYHCHYKPMEPEQRAEDIRNYDALHRSETHTPIP